MEIAFYQTQNGRSPVEDFITKLSRLDQARFTEIIVGIEENGLVYPRANFRQLEGKLWEIKFKAKGGGYRVTYVMLEKTLMIWLHAFKKKTQKTAKTDLETARARAKEILT